jgi:hypothetical protein
MKTDEDYIRLDEAIGTLMDWKIEIKTKAVWGVRMHESNARGIEISASAVSRARACPPSLRTDGIQVVTGDLPAAGQALHHYMMCAIGYGQHMETAHVAAMFRADPEEVERLCQQTWRAWSAIRHWFGDRPQCEVFLEAEFGHYEAPIKLSGHIDALGLVPARRQIPIVDWKSSWAEESHDDQMRAYAYLALENEPGYDEVWAAIIRPRQGTYDAQVYRWDDLVAWKNGLIERLTGRGSDQFHIGEQCLRCPRAASCPAVADLIRQGDEALDLDAHDDLTEAERCIAVYTNIRILESHCEAAWHALKSKVAAAGGRIGNLVLTEEARETIRLTEESEMIIGAHMLSWDEWSGMVNLKKTELKKAVMSRAEQGQKTAKWDAVVQQLREAGAVEKTFVQKLELRRSNATDTAAIQTSAGAADRDGGVAPA